MGGAFALYIDEQRLPGAHCTCVLHEHTGSDLFIQRTNSVFSVKIGLYVQEILKTIIAYHTYN